ncbi:hypothetical protein Zmor_027595 [Zophobas morio]|uniref:Lipase n=1 Tax=Zophobas morio TaxID=2755281 RepID=A0AA38HNL2_9CUCU|nr:hypothetical protein Zmor_027595 [Zophobas morio]
MSLKVIVVTYILFQGQPSACEDAYQTVSEIVSHSGYPVQVHHVTTFDGYILALHRIPHGRKNTLSNKPVLMLQGAFIAAVGFVFTGVDHALGYLLADEGYDVWLADVRGCHSSRNHTTLNPDTDPKFWDFSWNEMATIDVPAMIDYVLQTTNQPNLYYVGYSQGSALLFITMSLYPEYNAKVRVHVGLAPGGYIDTKKINPLHVFANGNDLLNTFLERIGMNELPPPIYTFAQGATCRVSPDFCRFLLMTVFRYKPSEVNSTIVTSFLNHFPASASRRQTIHILGLVRSGLFKMDDFGAGNVKVYGTSTPPLVNLGAVTAKTHLFCSDDDDIVSDFDVSRLCEELGACVEKHLVTEGTIKHLDWLMGPRIRELIYSKLVKVMARY